MLEKFATKMICRWIWMAGLALMLAPGSARAQAVMIVDGANAFEGNAGTTIIRLPVRFQGTQSETVTGTVSALALGGNPFNPPTPGPSCTAGVDFIPFTNVPFSVPPNTPNGTLSVNVTLCGNTTIEPDEHILVSLAIDSGAQCSLDRGCTAIGTIVNDDGPPAISIASTSVSTLSGASGFARFTVSLHHLSASPVSVNYVTRDGSARASTTTRPGAYSARSSTLTIPAGSPSGTISIPITGFGGGTFFVDLSGPANGTLTAGATSAQATIRIIDLTIGSFQVEPDEARVSVGDRTDYAVTWTVPPDQVWRNLDTIDFRLRSGNQTALWLRWDEAGDTFRLCESRDSCGPAIAAGSAEVLETEHVRLYLADTRVVGSGPTGQSVTLHLSLEFLGESAGHRYRMELAATDDLGRADDFAEATTVHVWPLRRPVR